MSKDKNKNTKDKENDNGTGNKDACSLHVKEIVENISGGSQIRNVNIRDRRTSIRLETKMWAALGEIAEAENCNIHDLCATVYDLKDPDMSFTAALRAFLMEYFRAAALVGVRVEHIRREKPGGIEDVVLSLLVEGMKTPDTSDD